MLFQQFSAIDHETTGIRLNLIMIRNKDFLKKLTIRNDYFSRDTIYEVN